MCVSELEPQGGGDWRTEPSFFPWRERGEYEIRSGSGGVRFEQARLLPWSHPPVLEASLAGCKPSHRC